MAARDLRACRRKAASPALIAAIHMPWVKPTTLAATNKYLAGGNKSQHERNATLHQTRESTTGDYVTKIVLTFTTALVIALPSLANATCGTRGGPELRGPDGKCQSWDQVRSVCGADGSRCQREQVNPLYPKLDTTNSHKLMECAHHMRNDC